MTFVGQLPVAFWNNRRISNNTFEHKLIEVNWFNLTVPPLNAYCCTDSGGSIISAKVIISRILQTVQLLKPYKNNLRTNKKKTNARRIITGKVKVPNMPIHNVPDIIRNRHQ